VGAWFHLGNCGRGLRPRSGAAKSRRLVVGSGIGVGDASHKYFHHEETSRVDLLGRPTRIGVVALATRKPIQKRSVPASATKKKKAPAAAGVAKRKAAPKAAEAEAEESLEAEEALVETDGGEDAAPAGKSTGRRATAQSMASKQRDISVSEFLAKNRHLLGFDNPRKALLTTIKEAVDNSLDACEEAGILPEIWVHIEQTSTDRYK